MLNKFKLLMGIVILLILVLALAGCGTGENQGQDATKPVVKIGYLPITHSLPLVVADARQEEFEHFILEPVKFSGWPELTEALNSGQIQGAITMFELAMTSKERGVPVEIALLSHRNGDVLVGSKEISSVKDFIGRTVAIPHRLSGHNILLYRALTEAGLDYAEVKKVEMAPPDMPAALARGEIDGYIVAEPFGARAVVDGFGKVILRAQDIWPGWICCGLVFDPEFSDNHDEAALELVTAMVQAGKFIEANPEEAVSISAEYMQIPANLWETSLKWINYGDLTPKLEEFEQLQQYLLELPWEGRDHTLLKQPVALDELVRTDYAERAAGQVQ